MSASESKPSPAVGFLTIREYRDRGLIGGYLILNANGRPLEFHCTAPVRPNRAQRILYGPTLEPFLYGEQIGQALTSKAKHDPLFICTDVEPVLALREHVSHPVVFLAAGTAEDAAGAASTQRRIDPPHVKPARGRASRFTLGDHSAVVALMSAEDDRQTVEQCWPRIGELDLFEPFSRLSEAIDETQAGAAGSR